MDQVLKEEAPAVERFKLGLDFKWLADEAKLEAFEKKHKTAAERTSAASAGSAEPPQPANTPAKRGRAKEAAGSAAKFAKKGDKRAGRDDGDVQGHEAQQWRCCVDRVSSPPGRSIGFRAACCLLDVRGNVRAQRHHGLRHAEQFTFGVLGAGGFLHRHVPHAEPGKHVSRGGPRVQCSLSRASRASICPHRAARTLPAPGQGRRLLGHGSAGRVDASRSKWHEEFHIKKRERKAP